MPRRYGDMMLETDGAAAAGATTTSSSSPTAHGARAGRRRSVRSAAPLPAASLPAINLHGVRLHAITEQRANEHILDELDAGRGGAVVTPNLDHLRRYTRDLSFGALVSEAELVVADGMPLIWASRLQRTPLPQRVAGSDLISSLSAAAAKRGRSIFLLGGMPGTADGAAAVLQRLNPELRVAGTHCPPFGFEENAAEMDNIIAILSTAKPDIVFVALGSPKQEYLIQQIRGILPQAWWLGVGISFSFLCGEVRRAPRWLQKIGMEWLHRLFQDPKRLFHRYIVVGIPFGASMMSRALVRGLAKRISGDGSVADPSGRYLSPPSRHGHNGNGNGLAAASARAGDEIAGTRDGATTAVMPIITPRPRRTRTIDAAIASTLAPTADARRSLSRLRAMILLNGSIRSSQLADLCGRSVLDLPLDHEGSIFNHWLLQAAELARHAGLEKLPVRVMVNRNAPEPVSASPKYVGTFRVERDLSEYRGTGGVLRDLAVDYADDDLVLVCNAAQILLDPLAAVATALDKKEGDVTLVSHADGTPSGVQLIACKALREIPEVGFIDMKEQALPLIAQKYDVTVLHCRRPTAMPVRTAENYIEAMKLYHGRKSGRPTAADPLAENWQPTFQMVEQGAVVDPRAHVHDSIVLKGGVVEAGGVVVRSIVCPGGVVRKDKPRVDQVVTLGE
jgi:N-acetylglucosaminyldiphosphoundecaprenol N-acetyl-beta-D-mannosaminyltransferase